MKNNELSLREICKKVIAMKVTDWFNMACSDGEQWIKVEKLNYHDSIIVIAGGYGYHCEIIANSYQLEENLLDDIVVKFAKYIDNEFGIIANGTFEVEM